MKDPARGKRIERRIREAGWDVAALAREIGVSRPTIYGWIGGGNLKGEHLIKLAAALERSPEWIDGGESLRKYTGLGGGAPVEVLVRGGVQEGTWSREPHWPAGRQKRVMLGELPEIRGERLFGLEVVDSSFEPRWRQGTILVCGERNSLDGLRAESIVVVSRSEGALTETTCRRLHIAPDGSRWLGPVLGAGTPEPGADWTPLGIVLKIVGDP